MAGGNLVCGTIDADTIQGDSGADDVVVNGVNTCKGWIHFDGTGTVSIDASYNVDSLTDNGTGNYTINLTTAMATANYSAVASSGGTDKNADVDVFATSSFRIYNTTSAGAAEDQDDVCAAIFGDQ